MELRLPLRRDLSQALFAPIWAEIHVPTAVAWLSVETSNAARFAFVSGTPLDIERIAAACRGHWGVESMHWLLDVEFNDDLSRYRAEHGVKNMATLRRFALNLVRANKRKGSVKTRRKSASWDPAYLLEILSLP